MPRQTKFPTIPLSSIQSLIDQVERLDAEEAVAICLNCGHPAGDHSIENETGWHSNVRSGIVTICDCQGWRQGLPSSGAAD